MYTTWDHPPILEHPTGTRTAGARTYQLYTERGKLRMIAWRQGSTEIWITDTLQNDLTNDQLIGLGRTCR